MAWTMSSAKLFATTAGETYTFSFWLQADDDLNNHIAVSFNSLTLLNLTNLITPGCLYRQYEFSVLGTGTDTISFAGRASAGFVRLDDVYFGVPELAPVCARLPLLIAGLLLTASRRKRGALVP